MPVPLPIETDRLTVREFVPEADVDPMAAVYCDAEVMRFIPGGALVPGAVRDTLEEHARAQQRQGFSSWAVVLRGNGQVIGDAGFGIFQPTGEIELGYTLGRDYWGHGYATEASAACLSAGLTHLSGPILAVVDIENQRSIRVAERIGMSIRETVQAHGRPHFVLAANR